MDFKIKLVRLYNLRYVRIRTQSSYFPRKPHFNNSFIVSVPFGKHGHLSGFLAIFAYFINRFFTLDFSVSHLDPEVSGSAYALSGYHFRQQAFHFYGKGLGFIGIRGKLNSILRFGISRKELYTFSYKLYAFQCASHNISRCFTSCFYHKILYGECFRSLFTAYAALIVGCFRFSCRSSQIFFVSDFFCKVVLVLAAVKFYILEEAIKSAVLRRKPSIVFASLALNAQCIMRRVS